MQARVDWVLRIFGTQVTKKKRPVRPVFPDYLSFSYDYDQSNTTNEKLILKKGKVALKEFVQKYVVSSKPINQLN